MYTSIADHPWSYFWFSNKQHHLSLYTCMCMYRERKRVTSNSGQESKSQSFRWSLRVNKQEAREDMEGNVFYWFKKNHSKRIFLTASHSRTCGHTSWRWTDSWMLSHVRRECFWVITLPAVENKRSGAAEVTGIASTRIANIPNAGERFTATQRHSSRGFLSLGKGLPCLDLPVSDLCASKVERIHSSCHQMPHSKCHQMPSPFVTETARNIWTQAESILVERTINQNIEVVLF